MEPFDQVKAQILANLSEGLDFSPKGSIDVPVRDLVALLNALSDYVTTSSCSGRISVSFPLHENKGVHWTLVKHGFVTREELQRSISTAGLEGAKNMLFTIKCEPLILHLCCRDAEAAKALHQLAMESGYRESGVTLGQRRVMLAVRTTAFHLEMPLARNGRFLFDTQAQSEEKDISSEMTVRETERDFLDVVVDEANQRLRANFARADRLLSAIKTRFAFPYFSLFASSLSSPSLSPSHTVPHSLFAQEPHLWHRAGHTTLSLNNGDLVVVGGHGVEHAPTQPAHTTSAGRKVLSFSLSEYAATQRKQAPHNALTQNRARSIYRELPVCVHARAVCLTLPTSQSGVSQHVLVLSGGRESPLSPALPALSVYVLRACARTGETRYVRVLDERVRCVSGGCGVSPAARWAHSVERLTENSLFLCGGRDAERIFDDAFVATLRWDALSPTQTENESVTEREGELVVQWTQPQWRVVVSVSQPALTTPPHVFSRFAHASVSVWAAEESVYGGESGARQVLLHGGAASLSDPAALCEDAFMLNLHTHTIQPVVFSTQRALTTSQDDKGENDSNITHSATSSYVLSNASQARVGHTITALPGKCLLVVGGGAPASLWEYSSVSPLAPHCEMAVRDVSVSDAVNGESVSLPCAQCRSHHSALYDAVAQTVSVLGGGADSLAFGAHYCASCVLHVTEAPIEHTTLSHKLPACLSVFDNTSSSSSLTEKKKRLTAAPHNAASQRARDTQHFALLSRPLSVKRVKTLLEREKLIDRAVKIFRASLSDSLTTPSHIVTVSLSGTHTVETTHTENSTLSEGDVWMAVPLTARGHALVVSEGFPQSALAAELRDALCESVVRLCAVEELSVTRDSASQPALTTAVVTTQPAEEVVSHTAEPTQPSDITLSHNIQPYKKRVPCVTPPQRAHTHLTTLLTQYIARTHTTDETTASDCKKALCAELPTKYESVGDVLMIPADALRGDAWRALIAAHGERDFWRDLARVFGAQRVARKAWVHCGPMRQSQVELLYVGDVSETSHTTNKKKKLCVCGEDHSTAESAGWVMVSENRVRFSFDITRVMFCSGNNTERMRMGALRIPGETVVDCYCGIGYYTLPLLAFSGLRYLYALEWNPDSVFALKHNLANNKIAKERYEIRFGDNRETSRDLVSVADRVLLGLLPSSVQGWPIAVRALKSSGGVIHVHENVHERDIAQWVEDMRAQFERLFREADKAMTTRVLHVETVKSYAPRVFHYVIDMLCVPVKECEGVAV